MRGKWNRLFLFLFIFVAACTPAPTPTPTPEPTPTELPEISKFCLVTDVGTITDGTFNEFAYDGLLDIAENYSIADEDIEIIETQPEEEFIDNINRCIENGAHVVVTTGFLIQDAAFQAATENPNVYFIGVDHNVAGMENAPSNYVGIQFREDQAGFLVGVLAALLANEQGADTIAGIYGLEIPPVMRYRNGYEQGALYINPEWEIGVNILGSYGDSFTDREQGEARAQEYLDAGAAVIFGAGGPLGSAGIILAAQEGVLVIGVDNDEFYTTFDRGAVDGAEFLISSALKRVDQGVYDAIEFLLLGRFEAFPGGDNYVLGAAEGGIGFAEPHDASLEMALQSQVTEALQGLVDGTISTNVDFDSGNLITEESTEATEESSE